MNRRLDALFRALPLAAFALPLLSSSAAAQEEPRGASFELFGGAGAFYSSDRGFSLHAESLGARGGFRLTRIWTVEAELSRTSDFRALWNGDLSAKAYLFQTDRFRLFVLAGPGLQSEVVAGHTDLSSTVHAAARSGNRPDREGLSASGGPCPLADQSYQPRRPTHWTTRWDSAGGSEPGFL